MERNQVSSLFVTYTTIERLYNQQWNESSWICCWLDGGRSECDIIADSKKFTGRKSYDIDNFELKMKHISQYH